MAEKGPEAARAEGTVGSLPGKQSFSIAGNFTGGCDGVTNVPRM